VECNSAEDSPLFNRTFHAALAWGLLFLLPPDNQRLVIAKVAQILNRNGRFLFTSPKEAVSWNDAMTGLPSVSLGHNAYVHELAVNNLELTANAEDEGQNYYYLAVKI
jgi:hypothetical protein